MEVGLKLLWPQMLWEGVAGCVGRLLPGLCGFTKWKLITGCASEDCGLESRALQPGSQKSTSQRGGGRAKDPMVVDDVGVVGGVEGEVAPRSLGLHCVGRGMGCHL